MIFMVGHFNRYILYTQSNNMICIAAHTPRKAVASSELSNTSSKVLK
eukprot:UN16402